ncbi:MAG TPA: site-specific tyrosine recombinase/integron integrase [Clostridia bacterium]
MTNKLQQHITDFINYLSIEKNCSPLTTREYKRYLRGFSEWLRDNYPDKGIEELDMPMVSAFRVYLSEKPNVRGGKLAKVSQNHYVICLRSFLKFLQKNDVKVMSPEKIELPRTHSRSPKFLDSRQVEKLLAMPDIKTPWGLRDRTILELFFSTGLRVSELFRLNRDSVNLASREFSIVGKGSKTRLVFISDEAAKWIAKYLEIRKDNFKPLFIRYSREINTDGEKMRLSVSSIERMVKSYIRFAGISVDATPHTLRHSFASDLLRNGANLVQIQHMLGHSNIATTQIYTHVTNDELRNAHKQFHGARKV